MNFTGTNLDEAITPVFVSPSVIRAPLTFPSNAADAVWGYGGDDLITTLGGEDLVRWGAGDDSIFGGNADDTIYGEGGLDTVDASEGSDTVFGGGGRDYLYGDAGPMRLRRRRQRQSLRGGPAPTFSWAATATTG
jgi:hypothetical protein